MRRALPVSVLLLCACSVVKMHRVRDDYAAVDALKTRRLALVVAPLPDGNAKAGEMLAKMARRYVHQKRDDFYVKKDLAQAAPADLPALCGEDGIEGVLWLTPAVKRAGEGVEGDLAAKLLRCRDQTEVWAAEAAGSFSSKDERLVEVTNNYTAEFGEEVRPYAAPAMNVLRPLLDTLPTPAVSDPIREERISDPD